MYQIEDAQSIFKPLLSCSSLTNAHNQFKTPISSADGLQVGFCSTKTTAFGPCHHHTKPDKYFLISNFLEEVSEICAAGKGLS